MAVKEFKESDFDFENMSGEEMYETIVKAKWLIKYLWETQRHFPYYTYKITDEMAEAECFIKAVFFPEEDNK